MPKINTIATVPVPKLSDKLVGTSVGGTPVNQTNNFTLQQLKTLFDGTPVSPNLQAVLNAGNTATQNIYLTGTIAATNATIANDASSKNLYLSERLFDRNNFQGTSGQYLTSTGTGVQWSTLTIATPTLQQVLTAGNISDKDITTTGNIQGANIQGTNITANSNLRVIGGIADSTNSFGTSGQVLSSTVTGTDWVDLPSYSAVSPLIYNNISREFSIQQATDTQNGYLSSADWITFNGKQNSGNYITELTGEASALGPGAVNITLNNLAVINKTLTGLAISSGVITAADSIVTAFGKIQGQINGIVAGVVYQGVWNAATNNPTLTSSVGVQGNYYVVDVAGNTNLNGITDWQVGDWAIFNGSVWQKVDNTDAVTSVNGQTGIVLLNTDDISEGTTNLYYLDSRARAAISSLATGLTYTSSTGVFSLTSGYSIPTIANQTNWTTAYNDSIVSASVTGTTTKTLTLNQQDGGTITASWTDIDTNLVTSVFGRTGAVVAQAGDYSTTLVTEGTNLYYLDSRARAAISSSATGLTYTTATGVFSFTSGYSIPTDASQSNWTTAYNDSIVSAAVTGTTTKTLTLNQQDGGTITASWTDLDTGLTSVGLTMPSAFTVSNSPLTSNGTLSVTAAGNASQYVRGDGTLGDFPTGGGGGGSSVSYYLNGSINQGAFGGNTYYQMSKTPIFGAGTDFSINANGYIAQFITDVGIPDALLIPGGNWNFETYFSASSGGGSPTFYIELYKYDGTTFTLIASNSGNPELISFGTNIDPYFNSLAVPETVLTTNDRLAIRIYVNNSGRTITLHTENGHLCEVITTFTTGLTALNGLTKQVQYFAVGTSGSDFNISSSVATHTFNLPTASAVNRGALSSADWSTFNAKQNALTLTTTGSSGPATLIGATLNIPNYGSALSGYVPTSRTLTINGTTFDLSANRTWSVGTVTSVAALTLGTSGTNISSTVANGTTTPVITLNVPTASATNRGALSAADWTTFNNKQASGNYITSLTGEVTASGPGAAAATLNNASVTSKILTGVNITGGSISATDSMLTAFGKLQNQINSLIGGSIYQGTWDASTNTPTLTSSVGTNGYYYIVNVAGSTNLNGITDWKVGDWAIFHGGTWQKVDNTDAVTSVNGQIGAVSLNTDNIPEGSTNQYYLNSRARAALSFAAGSGAYNASTGVITIPTNTNQLTNGAAFITLGSLSGTSPISYNSGTGAISIQQATSTQNGFLSSTDWTTFNNKQANIAAGTTAQYFRGDKTFQTLNTAAVPESGNLYYTNARAIASTLTGYVSGAGTISSADSILSAIQKLNGNIGSLTTGVSSVFGRTGAVVAANGDYYLGTTAIQAASANQAITGITGITFVAQSTDAASITATISSTSTFFDFNLSDDNLNDEWRWRFTPSGASVYDAMRLVPTTNTTSNLIVSGNIVKSGGTSSQFLKADGSVDSNTYLTGNQTITLSGDATGSGTTAITVTLANSGVTAGTYNNVATQVRPFTVDAKGRITSIGTAVTITPAFSNITGKPTTLAGYGITDAVPSNRTITINGVTQDLSLNRTYDVGTVTSVGLSSTTSGVTIGSTPVTSSGTITLEIATASGLQNGLLSSTDWTTFNNKQANIVAGTTAQYYRGDKTFQTLNTAAVPELTNLYFTTARVLATALTGYVVGANTALAATDTILAAFGKVQGQLNAKGSGTVTSVAALTIGTTGTDITSTVANGTTTPVITLNIPTASAANRGALSSADWTTFNGKQANIVAGTTAQYYRGDKTFQTLNTAAVPESGNLYFTNARVLATALTGYVVGANTALAATDTILAAFGKVQGQLNAKGSGTVTSVGGTGTVNGLTLTGTVTTTGNLTLGGTLAIAATQVTSGTLPITRGGTGATTTIQGGIVYGASTSEYATTAASTLGYVLTSGGTGAPSFLVNDLTLFPSSNFKKSVKAATTANITLSAPQTIDGIACVAGDRVLVKNQTTASQNGIYIVNAAAWTRSVAADGSDEIDSAVVGVDQGTVNGGAFFTNYFKTTDVVGTTAMPWYNVVDTSYSVAAGSTKTDGAYVGYTGTTNTAGYFYGGTTTPTGTTRLNYSGYLYPTFLNLIGSSDTATASSHYYVETGSDGFVRPKTLANVRTEVVGGFSGNLSSTALPYATISSTASDFKVAFLNTTGNASGNFGLLHDSTASLVYNPSTNILTAGNYNATDGTRQVFLNPAANFGNGANPTVQVLSNHALQFATNNGLRAMITAGGNVLIGTTTDNGFQLQVNSNISADSISTSNAFIGSVSVNNLGTGTVYSNAGVLTNINPSDFNLKDNIAPINYGLGEILQLNPITFNWKNDTINQGKQYGFIAQEVEKIMPDLVKKGEYLGLDKEAIFTILVKAIHELKQEIDTLKK